MVVGESCQSCSAARSLPAGLVLAKPLEEELEPASSPGVSLAWRRSVLAGVSAGAADAFFPLLWEAVWSPGVGRCRAKAEGGSQGLQHGVGCCVSFMLVFWGVLAGYVKEIKALVLSPTCCGVAVLYHTY